MTNPKALAEKIVLIAELNIHDYDYNGAVDKISTLLTEYTDKVFEERGYAFQEAIQKCLKERNAAYDRAAEVAELFARKWGTNEKPNLHGLEVAKAIRALKGRL